MSTLMLSSSVVIPAGFDLLSWEKPTLLADGTAITNEITGYKVYQKQGDGSYSLHTTINDADRLSAEVPRGRYAVAVTWSGGQSGLSDSVAIEDNWLDALPAPNAGNTVDANDSWASIQTKLDALTPGDVLYFSDAQGDFSYTTTGAAVYAMIVDNTKVNGTAANPLHLVAVPGESPKIVGVGWSDEDVGPVGAQHLLDVRSNYVRVHGIRFTESGSFGAVCGGSFITFSECEFDNCWGEAVRANWWVRDGSGVCDTVKWEYCSFHHNRQGSGIVWRFQSNSPSFWDGAGYADNHVVKRCFFYRNGYTDTNARSTVGTTDSGWGGNSDGLTVFKDNHGAYTTQGATDRDLCPSSGSHDTTNIVLASTAGPSYDQRPSIYIHSGTNAGLARVITAYDDGTKVATVTPALPTACDNTSYYEICARTGDTDGRWNMMQNHQLFQNICFHNADDGYDFNSGDGGLVVGNISFQNSPMGNRGLKQFNTHAGRHRLIGNLFVGGPADYDIISFTAGDGTISVSDTITGGTSGATATVDSIDIQTGTWGVDADGILYVSSRSGVFITGEELRVGGTRQATSTFTWGVIWDSRYNFWDTQGTCPSSGSHDTTHVVLASGASAINGEYDNRPLVIDAGTNAGELRKITSYDGPNRIATITPALSTACDNTTEYHIPELNLAANMPEGRNDVINNTGIHSDDGVDGPDYNLGAATSVSQGGDAANNLGWDNEGTTAYTNFTTNVTHHVETGATPQINDINMNDPPTTISGATIEAQWRNLYREILGAHLATSGGNLYNAGTFYSDYHHATAADHPDTPADPDDLTKLHWHQHSKVSPKPDIGAGQYTLIFPPVVSIAA